LHLTILSPTIFESAALLNYIDTHFTLDSGKYKKGGLSISLSVSGVGLVNTAIHTSQVVQKDSDLMILIGLAGAFSKESIIGTVYNVTEECFGDLGAEDQDGTLLSVHDLDLVPSNKPPFKNGKLVNPIASEFSFLPKASSVSVNKVSGSQNSIDLIRSKFNADIENMEGAAFFQVCLQHRKRFLQLRAISNHVEPRNKGNWQINTALVNLTDVLVSIIDNLVEATANS